jgi:hypothetical protein
MHRMHRTGIARPVGLLTLSLSLLQVTCLVDSRCQTDYDCTGGKRCSQATGQCILECRSNEDCWVQGAFIGKECWDHRCVFRFDERVAAPNFCMQVVNPRSQYFEDNLCLNDRLGKVVVLYFGWLT